MKEATCLWCGRFVLVSTKNVLKYHRCAGGGKCDGSGKPPEIFTEIPDPPKKLRGHRTHQVMMDDSAFFHPPQGNGL